MNRNPEAFHDLVYDSSRRELGFNPSIDYAEWRSAMQAKFLDVIKLPEKSVEPKPIVEYEISHSDCNETRFVFESEKGYFVPCHLLTPNTGKKKYPVMICLQGHSSGMHISLARAKYSGDEKSIFGGDRNFAQIAVRNGYAALVMEQRCFGECLGYKRKRDRCAQASMQALLLGRTMLGERAFDVSRAIDCISYFDFLDKDKVACMGNSGGGTATYYTACVEPRIKAAMPSCSFCTVKDSIFDISHCVCNYMPDMLKYFEMADLACLIAPRPLVCVMGEKDGIFPANAVREAFETVRQIYALAGATDKCCLVAGAEGHRFYADAAWKEFNSVFK